MSRAAVSKSRADKGAKPGPPAHTPVVAHEIVPGKFNDQDWTFMVEKDGSEEFVEDIIDELVDNTLDVIYDNYIGHQLLPFTVTMAKDAILQIIEWQFLSRDEGEQNVETDPGWMQDEEPDPAVTDCWAQGSVPKALVPERPMTPVEEEVEEKVEETAVVEEEEEKVEEEEPPELADKVSDTEEGGNQEEEQKANEEEKNKKKRTKYKPYTGKVKAGKGLNQMTESLEQTEMAMMYEEYVKSQEYEAAEKASGLLNMPVSCHSILKVQAGRPPGNKDVMYDDMGNVLAVIKLNPEKLPSHRVKVKYQVVDPAVEAAQARLEAMRHGRYMSRAIQRRIKRNKVEEIKPDEGNRYKVWKYEDLLAIEMCQNSMKGHYGAISTHLTYGHPESNYPSVTCASQTVHFTSAVDSVPNGAGLKLDKNLQEECRIQTINTPKARQVQNHKGFGDSCSIHDLVSLITDLQADVKRLHTKLDEMRNVPNEKPEMVECGTQTSQAEPSINLTKTYAQVVSQRPTASILSSSSPSSSPSPSFVKKETTLHSSPQLTKTESPKEAVRDGERSQCHTLLVGSSILRLVERKKLQLNVDVRTFRGAKINTIREKLQTLTMTKYHRIIIHVGGDDVSDNHSEQTIQNDFSELTSYIKSSNPNIQMVYLAITPRTDCDVIPTNRTLQEMCHKRHIVFISSYRVFVDKDNYQRNGLFSKDGIHLTKYGTAVFLKNIDRCLSPGILSTNDSKSSN